MPTPLEMLRHHVSGAIARGEAQPIVAVETPQSAIVLEDTPRFEILALGNGWAYQFTDKITGQSGFVQDDDAVLWEGEYESMMVAHGWPPSVWYVRSWDDCLDTLVSEYLH